VGIIDISVNVAGVGNIGTNIVGVIRLSLEVVGIIDISMNVAGVSNVGTNVVGVVRLSLEVVGIVIVSIDVGVSRALYTNLKTRNLSIMPRVVISRVCIYYSRCRYSSYCEIRLIFKISLLLLHPRLGLILQRIMKFCIYRIFFRLAELLEIYVYPYRHILNVCLYGPLFFKFNIYYGLVYVVTTVITRHVLLTLLDLFLINNYNR